jgi:signal transduction histidine kinase
MAEMGEMLSDISHQWKQPLTILSMLLETIELELEEEYISKEQIDSDLQEAFKLIKHMHQTIEDFKNFYRPDTSKRTFNIYNAVNDVIKMEKTSLNCHTIELSFNSSYKGTLFHGFESQFKQVLLTIINNAIEQITLNIESQKQAKGSGKIDIDIEKDNKNVKIHISDNAGGIDQDIIAKIFNPYFTTKNDNGGSGIGLYMSKTILEKNFHGSVQVLNVADGASFIITIPL